MLGFENNFFGCTSIVAKIQVENNDWQYIPPPIIYFKGSYQWPGPGACNHHLAFARRWSQAPPCRVSNGRQNWPITNNHNPSKIQIQTPSTHKTENRKSQQIFGKYRSFSRGKIIVWFGGACQKGKVLAGFSSCYVRADQHGRVFDRVWRVFLDLVSTFLLECCIKKPQWSAWKEDRGIHTNHLHCTLQRMKKQPWETSCSFRRRLMMKGGQANRQSSQRPDQVGSTMAGTEYGWWPFSEVFMSNAGGKRKPNTAPRILTLASLSVVDWKWSWT